VTDTPRAAHYELDMGSVVVRAGGKCNVNVQPREAFRPSRLRVFDECAEGFTVDAVSVLGHRDAPLAKGPLAASDFAGAGRELGSTRLVEASNFVTVSVTNDTLVDRVFKAVVSGPLAT